MCFVAARIAGRLYQHHRRRRDVRFDLQPAPDYVIQHLIYVYPAKCASALVSQQVVNARKLLYIPKNDSAYK